MLLAKHLHFSGFGFWISIVTKRQLANARPVAVLFSRRKDEDEAFPFEVNGKFKDEKKKKDTRYGKNERKICQPEKSTCAYFLTSWIFRRKWKK